MSRLFVRDIQPQASVDEVFRIADRQVRANRQGNCYLLVQLQDRTGVISAIRWNVEERIAEKYPKGSFVRVQGASQLHNGTLQLIVNSISPVEASQVDPTDFNAIDRDRNDRDWTQLLEWVATIKDPTVLAVCQAVVADPEWQRALRVAPAGLKTHHARGGGLLEHVVSLLALADGIANHYADIDHDLLLAGALLHDLGKVQELSFDDELAYSDAGQLLGHLVQGVVMIESVVNKLSQQGVALDRERILRLEHIIVSHHGSLEHGSPKVPMTLEAIAFHYLDELDARLDAARELVAQDRTRDPWTPFHPTLGRKLLKSSFECRSESVPAAAASTQKPELTGNEE